MNSRIKDYLQTTRFKLLLISGIGVIVLCFISSMTMSSQSQAINDYLSASQAGEPSNALTIAPTLAVLVLLIIDLFVLVGVIVYHFYLSFKKSVMTPMKNDWQTLKNVRKQIKKKEQSKQKQQSNPSIKHSDEVQAMYTGGKKGE